jgi:hypothetical protein
MPCKAKQSKRTPFVSAREMSQEAAAAAPRSNYLGILITRLVNPSSSCPLCMRCLRARPESLIAHFGTPRKIVRHDHFNNENINEPLIMHCAPLSPTTHSSDVDNWDLNHTCAWTWHTDTHFSFSHSNSPFAFKQNLLIIHKNFMLIKINCLFISILQTFSAKMFVFVLLLIIHVMNCWHKKMLTINTKIVDPFSKVIFMRKPKRNPDL